MKRNDEKSSQGYKFLKYEEMKDIDYLTSLFTGLVTYSQMLTICDWIDKPVETDLHSNVRGHFGALYMNDDFEEKEFDKIIMDNTYDIFGRLPDEQKIMWTGCYYKFKNVSWELVCQNNPSDFYVNFCNEESWELDLKNLQNETKKMPEKNIYFVKYFGKSNTVKSCWNLYNSKQLTEIMGQPSGTLPRLTFACMEPLIIYEM